MKEIWFLSCWTIITIDQWDQWDNDEILGIYPSKELAEEAMERYKRTDRYESLLEQQKEDEYFDFCVSIESEKFNTDLW